MPNPFRTSIHSPHPQLLAHSLCRFLSQRTKQFSSKGLLRFCDIANDQGEMALLLWKQLRKTPIKFHILVLREQKKTANQTRKNIPQHAPITVIEKNPLEILRTSSLTSPNGSKAPKHISKDDGILMSAQSFDMVYTSGFLSTLSKEEIYDWITLMTNASRLGLMACEPLKQEQSFLTRLKSTSSAQKKTPYTYIQWQRIASNLKPLKLKKLDRSIIILNRKKD